MKTNIIKYIFLVFIVILLAFAVYRVNSGKNDGKGATSANNTNQEQEITKEIKLAIAGLDTINPILSNNRNVQDVSRLIYEPLVNLSHDYKAEACLATEWARTDDTTYIIKLRENVQWSNGESFSGEDVQFTIDKLKEVSSIYSYNVQPVIGVDVVDEHTVKITLDRKVPFFEYNLTFPIMSKSYYEGEDFSRTEKNNKPMGTGIFKISGISESNIILEKNEKWWNASEKKAVLEKIIINTNSSMAEVYNAFKMGNIDLVSTANLNYADYVGTLGYTTKEYPGREHCFLALNTQNYLLANPEVRQAILYAIDKNNIVAHVSGGQFYSSDFPLSYGNWLDNKEDANATYNLALANKTLQDNGWTLRRGGWQKTVNRKTQRLNLNLLVRAGDATRAAVANVLQTQLAAAGIGISIRSASDAEYIASLASKSYDILLGAATVSASPDLTTYIGDDNLANYSNAEVSSIMQEVSNTTDENVLKEKYKRLKEIYKTDVPCISLYFDKKITIYNTNLAGEVNPNWYNLFYNIENWYK